MKYAMINGWIVTMNPAGECWKNGYLTFDGETIAAVGDMRDFHPEEGMEILDVSGKIIMPGMVNTHTHLGMIPFRGLGDDCKDRLRKLLLPLEGKCMTRRLVRASSRYAIAESLLDGVTTLLDMYYFEEEVAQAAADMGMRAFVGETVINQPVCDAPEPHGGLKRLEPLLEQWKDHPFVTPCVAPHATNTCSREVLEQAAALAERYNVPLTLHAAEMDYEMDFFRREYQQTPIEWLDTAGVLNSRLIAAHCIHVSDSDLNLMAERGVKVAHCIGSNTKAGKGVAPVKKMAERGMKVGLGTDGPSSGNTLDLFTQFKLAEDFHKNENRDRSLFPAREIIRMGTLGGAEVLGISQKTGSLEAGKQADIVVLETDSANMFPVYDPCSTIVYSANPSNVEQVWTRGVCRVRNHRLTEGSLADLRGEVWEAMEESGFVRTVEQTDY